MQIASPDLRILIAEAREIVRRGLGDLLSRPGWLVCGEASTGRQAVELAEQHKPDILIADIKLPELNGIEVARVIRRILPKTEVLILSLVEDILEAGLRAYGSKGETSHEVVLAVEALASQSDLLGQDRLTSREREVIQLIAEGKKTREVAVMLGISAKTADTHRANVMRKLDIHSVTGLVRYALKNQIVEL